MNTMMQPQQTKPLEMHSSPCTNPPPTPLRPECPKSQLLRPPATNTTETASMKRPATQRASAPDTARSWRRAGPAGGGAPGGRGGREGGKTRWESRWPNYDGGHLRGKDPIDVSPHRAAEDHKLQNWGRFREKRARLLLRARLQHLPSRRLHGPQHRGDALARGGIWESVRRNASTQQKRDAAEPKRRLVGVAGVGVLAGEW